MMDYRMFDPANCDREPRTKISLLISVRLRGIKRVLAIPRETALGMSATLLMLAVLTACQQTTPTKSRHSSGEAIDPAAGVDQSKVVEALSARSRIPTSELRQLLDDCSRTQLSMTLCALRDLVAAELALDAEREAMQEPVAPECRAMMDRAHVAWKEERDRICSEETKEDKGGSMYPMLLGYCKTTATKARILFVKEMGACPGDR